MRQTLFYIPTEIAGIPLFGFGLLLALWAVVSVVMMAWLVRRQGWNADTLSYIPILMVLGGVLAFVLPNILQPQGLPIRGYGVMMLIAVVSGVWLAVYRARQMGVDPEILLSLATWLFVAGIVGARAFYVIEYWESFHKPGDLRGTLINIVKFTEGGLVVYGSLICGGVALIVFVYKYRLPGLALGDLVAPSVLLGMALGRVGCFLNGCCYGGVCELPWAVEFPTGSPAHIDQVGQGIPYGMRIAPAEGGRNVLDAPVIVDIVPDSAADRAGLKVGDLIVGVEGKPVRTFSEVEKALQTHAINIFDRGAPVVSIDIETSRGTHEVITTIDELSRSRAVHPTQIYSTIDALLLSFLLWNYYPFRRRDGELVALTLTIHPISRFLLETIRTDEPSVFGTGLTISQNISLLILAGGIGLWIYILRQPRQLAWPAK